MMRVAKNPDDTGPNKAHNFSVRVNSAWVFQDGAGKEPRASSVNLSEREAWRVFISNKLNGFVELLRGSVVVARIGART